MDVESHKSSAQNTLFKNAECINYCILLSGCIDTASWLLPLDTQQKSFFILCSQLWDHIPNSLAIFLAFSNLEDVTEYQLEMISRIKPSKIPTWHNFQATIATNSSAPWWDGVVNKQQLVFSSLLPTISSWLNSLCSCFHSSISSYPTPAAPGGNDSNLNQLLLKGLGCVLLGKAPLIGS